MVGDWVCTAVDRGRCWVLSSLALILDNVLLGPLELELAQGLVIVAAYANELYVWLLACLIGSPDLVENLL